MKIKEAILMNEDGYYKDGEYDTSSTIIQFIAQFSQSTRPERLIIITENGEFSITKDKEGKTHIMRKEDFSNLLNRTGIKEGDTAYQSFWELLPPDEFNEPGILERIKRLKISRGKTL